jgi:hypothetical protein
MYNTSSCDKDTENDCKRCNTSVCLLCHCTSRLQAGTVHLHAVQIHIRLGSPLFFGWLAAQWASKSLCIFSCHCSLNKLIVPSLLHEKVRYACHWVRVYYTTVMERTFSPFCSNFEAETDTKTDWKKQHRKKKQDIHRDRKMTTKTEMV